MNRGFLGKEDLPSRSCKRYWKRLSSGILSAIASCLFFIFIASACAPEPESVEPPRILPPVTRLAREEASLQGDSGLFPSQSLDYDLFDFRVGVFLDDPFSSAEKWEKAKGRGDPEAVDYEFLESRGRAGDHVLRLGRKAPALGRLMALPAKHSLTACLRIRATPPESLKQLKPLCGVIEVFQSPDVGVKGLAPELFLSVHADWVQAAARDGWVDWYQVFTPQDRTQSLVIGLDGGCEGLDAAEAVQLDRLMLRVPTVAEEKASLVKSGEEDPARGGVLVKRRLEDNELRDAWFLGTPGEVVFVPGIGPERIFRYGLSFPSAHAFGHSRRIRNRIERPGGPGEALILGEETFSMDDARLRKPGWIERALTLPAAGPDDQVRVRAESLDPGEGVVALGAPCLVAPRTPSTPPNVLLVSIDTLRADRLGCYGAKHPEGSSPCIDRLAESSLLFENAASQAPFTLPSHVSMLPGQYPTVHGVQYLGNRNNPLRTPLVAAILGDAGYLTGGHTAGVLVHYSFGFDEGFDTYSVAEPLLYDNLDRTLRWIDANRDAPFFLFFHTFAVHCFAYRDKAYLDRFDPECRSAIRGFTTTPQWLDWLAHPETHRPEDRACLDNLYAAGVRMADDGVKTVLDRLRSLNLLDRTLIVITSDHGQELFERGTVNHGMTLYEEQIHVPILLRPPGGTLR